MDIEGKRWKVWREGVVMDGEMRLGMKEEEDVIAKGEIMIHFIYVLCVLCNFVAGCFEGRFFYGTGTGIGIDRSKLS